MGGGGDPVMSFEYYGRFGAVFITMKTAEVMPTVCPIWMSCWQPASTFRILFKINLLTYKTLREKQPVYLHSMLAASIPSRSLRSNNDNSLSVPRVKTNTGARAFHSCAPSLWNNLPLSVCSASSVATFKKYLKTHLFDLAFPP